MDPRYEELDRKREGRLTSIIDQLLSTKATPSTFGDVIKAERRVKGKHRPSDSSPILNLNASVSAASQFDSTSEAVHGDHIKKENETSGAHTTHISFARKARRKKISRNNPSSDLKRERGSPPITDVEIGSGSSRSVSPYSPRSNSFRSRTPTNAGTHINPFSLSEKCSPGNFDISNRKLMSEDLHTSRNYSDFMRSLAAKYNNSNPNDYRASNLISLLNNRSTCKEFVSAEGSSQLAHFSSSLTIPLLNFPVHSYSPTSLATHSTRKESDLLLTGSGSGKKERKEEYSTFTVLPASGLMQDTNIQPTLTPGFPSYPNLDMSSTQALLNMVRSASARNAHHLDTYINSGTTPTSALLVKRQPEAIGTASHIPLDLSAAVSKRQYVEQQSEPCGRNQLQEHCAARSPSTEPENLKEKNFVVREKKLSLSRFTSDGVTLCGNSYLEKKAQLSNKLPIQVTSNCHFGCAAHSCSSEADEVRDWTVNHVVDFVKSIELCNEYAQAFQEHSIDGSILPLLTEDHLTTNMNMKLGPALKLRSVLAKKIGHCTTCLHCAHCHAESTRTASSSPLHNRQNLTNANE